MAPGFRGMRADLSAMCARDPGRKCGTMYRERPTIGPCRVYDIRRSSLGLRWSDFLGLTAPVRRRPWPPMVRATLSSQPRHPILAMEQLTLIKRVKQERDAPRSQRASGRREPAHGSTSRLTPAASIANRPRWRHCQESTLTRGNFAFGRGPSRSRIRPTSRLRQRQAQNRCPLWFESHVHISM